MVANRILALLPEQERNTLLQNGVMMFLPIRRILYAPGQPFDAIYFPADCVVSLVIGVEDAMQVEMATIGSEGVVGVFSMLNAEKALGSHVVQIAGDALRVEFRMFNRYLQQTAVLRSLMQKYLYALMHQIMHTGACNQMHTMEERCARWLLMMHDRSGGDSFLLTQEFLSEMLGVRRATVNLTIGMLKSAGLVTYVRGRITILDRTALESASCPCYGLIKREYEELRLK